MSRLRINLLANFTGQATVSLVQLAIIPVYVRHLGIEAYGLIGFMATLQTLSQVLDLGMSPAVNRQLARYSVRPEDARQSRDFVRTLECVYLAVGVAIGLILFAAAPYFTHRWLHESTLPSNLVQGSLQLVAVAIAAQWPLTFYQGGLLGIERHPPLNAVRIIVTLLSAAGGYVIVTRPSPSILTFFAWQAVVNLGQVAVLAILLWRVLPAAAGRARFRLDLLRSIGKFAAGMSAITVTALVFTQLDKLVLSRLVSLEAFGYYTLAWTVGAGLATLIKPAFNSMFPRFAALAASGDAAALAATYRRGWEFVVVLLLPLAAVVAAFSFELILLWTRNPGVASAAAPLAALLVIGAAVNGLMNVPYALQLAHGWTRIPLEINIFLTVLAVPALIVSAQRFGVAGVAAMWPALNLVYMAVALPITHRRLMPALGIRWFLRDVILPAAVMGAGVLASRALAPFTRQMFTMALEVAMAWGVAQLALILSNATLRHDARRYLWQVFAEKRGPGLEVTAR